VTSPGSQVVNINKHIARCGVCNNVSLRRKSLFDVTGRQCYRTRDDDVITAALLIVRVDDIADRRPTDPRGLQYTRLHRADSRRPASASERSSISWRPSIGCGTDGSVRHIHEASAYHSSSSRRIGRDKHPTRTEASRCCSPAGLCLSAWLAWFNIALGDGRWKKAMTRDNHAAASKTRNIAMSPNKSQPDVVDQWRVNDKLVCQSTFSVCVVPVDVMKFYGNAMLIQTLLYMTVFYQTRSSVLSSWHKLAYKRYRENQ